MAKRGRKPKLQIDLNEEIKKKGTKTKAASKVKTEKIVIKRRGRKPKVKEDVKVEPKKRGRKPKVKTEETALPKKRGRKPKVKVEEAALPKKRGRKPKAKIEEVAIPKKRGRKPKAKIEEVAVPKKRGRKPKNAVVPEQEPVVAKKRGRKPKDQTAEKADKSPVFGSKKNTDLGTRSVFEKEVDKFPKFGPVQIPRTGGGGNKTIVHEEVFGEICKLLRTNYGNLACSAHLCQVNISCKNRKINHGDFVDNFNTLVNKYGLKDMNGRIVMMYEFDEIVCKDGQTRTEIGEGEDPDKDIDKEE